MGSRRRKNGAKGALLIEALVSFAIFLIASLAFYGMLANTRRADAKARHVLAANAYARQLMETQRSRGYASLALGTTRGSKQLTVERDGVKGSLNMASSVTISIGPGVGVKTILVQVTSTLSSVTLESYVTD